MSEPVDHGQCYYYVPRLGPRGAVVADEFVGCPERATWQTTVAERRVLACDGHRGALDDGLSPDEHLRRVK